MSELRRMITTFPSTPPHSSNKGTDLTRTWTDPRPDSKERALDNFKENYSSFLAAGGGLSAEAMIFSTICNGKSPYERMTEQNQIDEYKARIDEYKLTFVSPQDQLEDKAGLKQSLFNLVALLDVIDIGHDAMMKLDCIFNTYFQTEKDTMLLTNVLNTIFTREGNFRPVVGKEEIIAIIEEMYMLLKGNHISTFEPPPSILVLKETIGDVLPKLQAEYNRGREFFGFPESGRGIPGVVPRDGSVYSLTDAGSGSGNDSIDIKRYCSEYGIVHNYARFIRENLYEIIQIVEDNGKYHCFVILSTNEISLNQVLVVIHRYLSKEYTSAERGSGFMRLSGTMKIIKYENIVIQKEDTPDVCAEKLHESTKAIYENDYMVIKEHSFSKYQLKSINYILESCLWALKSMGDKGGTIGFFEKQKEIFEEELKRYNKSLTHFQAEPVENKCIMWTVDSFLAAIIPGYYYAGLIHEYPIVALSNAKGWDVYIPPSSDSTGYATSLYQLYEYRDIDFLKENYGFNHLEYVVHILFPSIRDTTHVSFFYRILRALLNNILVYIERKFNDYDTAMKDLLEDLQKFEEMPHPEKQAFLLRVPNELTLDFSSIIGKLLLLFFEFSQENEQETAQKIFNKIAALNRLNRFDEILGTKRTMNDLIGSNLDVLLNAFRHTPGTPGTSDFLQFITLTEVMDTEGISATPSVLEEKKKSLKENMGDKAIDMVRSPRLLELLEARERLYNTEVKTLQEKVEKHSHLKEYLVGPTTLPLMPRTLEVRIETLPDTTFIYVRTIMTIQAKADEYTKYLRDMTRLAEEEDNNFSIEMIDGNFYIKFPINVQFLADFFEKYSTQQLGLYTMTRGEWSSRQQIYVKPFCEREIRNILEQLFPREVLTDSIEELLPVSSTILQKVVNTVKRVISPKSSNIKTELSTVKSKTPKTQEGKIFTTPKTLGQIPKTQPNKTFTKPRGSNKGGRKTRRIRKKFTLKHKKRSMRKTQRRRNIIK